MIIRISAYLIQGSDRLYLLWLRIVFEESVMTTRVLKTNLENRMSEYVFQKCLIYSKGVV